MKILNSRLCWATLLFQILWYPTAQAFGECVFEDQFETQAVAGIENAGFETALNWAGLIAGESPYYAPVEGSRYAEIATPGEPIIQHTDILIKPGVRYEVTAWARSIYDQAHTARLAAATYQDLPVTGTAARTTARLVISAAGVVLASSVLDVSPRGLLGDAQTVPSDDGANVWIDGEYRVQFNSSILYQPISSDPIADPWSEWVDPSYDQDNAVGVVNIPGGQRFVFDCFYSDDPPKGQPWESLITLRPVGGEPLQYFWGPREFVLFNETVNTGNEDDQFPWVIDAHAFHDPETGRLWMSWGGHDLYVTELDPTTGRAIDPTGSPIDPDISTLDPDDASHPVHTMVVQEQPEDELQDPWRRSTYQEGPAIYKHGDYFYYFATYGNLVYDYTIRVGRATNPRGPYLDREGRPLIAGGGTFLLGDDSAQLVPGHPHIWEESGVFYLGYDYRTERNPADGEVDFMGIRRLYWVDGWPTIWRPVTATFVSDDHPDATGQSLVISAENVGDPEAVLALDRVSVKATSPCQ